MFCAIELQVFDEHIRAGLGQIRLGRIRRRISSDRPYVARLELQGSHLARHYLRPRWDYRQARSKAASGVMLRYLIDAEPGDIYEIAEHATRRRLAYRFVRFEHGTEIHLTEQESIACLSSKSRSA